MKIFYTLLLAICGLSLHAQQSMAPALQTALQNRLNELLESEDLNGVSCYLESAEHGYWYGAAGIENIAQNRPMDTTYSFWAASVNKIFTSALIFMLYEDSLLDIEDKIVDYVPGHSNINPNATIEQALNHSSGIAEILRHPSAAQQWYNHNANKVWDPNEVLSNYLQAQDFAPGSAWSYSNTNYILLGMIIEKVSGKSYAEFLEEKIILPLSLSNTWFPPFMESEQAISKGYSDFNQDGEWDDANFLHTPSFASMVFAAGALVSTPKDLTKMAQALYNGNLFSNPETLEHYLQFLPVRISQHALGYGYGCNSFDYLGDTYYGHGGDINGYTNYAINSPDAGISFGLMINRDQADREFVTEELLKVLKNASVGITDNFDPGVKIFPNPASEQIFVQGLEPNSKISIINSLGKTVLVSTQSQMDVSSLSDGVYVLQCFKDGKMITQRFSVE